MCTPNVQLYAYVISLFVFYNSNNLNNAVEFYFKNNNNIIVYFQG